MKVIIAGSRTITDYALIKEAIIMSQFLITEVVSGGATGVDSLGEEWANQINIPIKKFPADWNKFGKSAGYRRNVEMANYADALIAITNGSVGTSHMINIAKNKNLKVFVYTI